MLGVLEMVDENLNMENLRMVLERMSGVLDSGVGSDMGDVSHVRVGVIGCGCEQHSCGAVRGGSMEEGVVVRYLNSNDFEQLRKAHVNDVGYDIGCAEDGVLKARSIGKIRTGVRIAIPVGYEGVMSPRGGLAIDHGVIAISPPIDPGYRGEIFILVVNTSAWDFEYRKGFRLAQLVIRPVFCGRMVKVDGIKELGRSVDGRGDTGFGNSGIGGFPDGFPGGVGDGVGDGAGGVVVSGDECEVDGGCDGGCGRGHELKKQEPEPEKKPEEKEPEKKPMTWRDIAVESWRKKSAGCPAVFRTRDYEKRAGRVDVDIQKCVSDVRLCGVIGGNECDYSVCPFVFWGRSV